MKLKVTRPQLECLCKLLNVTLKLNEPSDNIDRLLIAHMTDLHKRLVKKFVDHQEKYTVDLPDPVAIAFFEYWQGINIDDPYGRNTIDRILFEIDSNNLVKSI